MANTKASSTELLWAHSLDWALWHSPALQTRVLWVPSPNCWLKGNFPSTKNAPLVKAGNHTLNYSWEVGKREHLAKTIWMLTRLCRMHQQLLQAEMWIPWNENETKPHYYMCDLHYLANPQTIWRGRKVRWNRWRIVYEPDAWKYTSECCLRPFLKDSWWLSCKYVRVHFGLPS